MCFLSLLLILVLHLRAQPKLIEHGLPIKRAEMEGKLSIPHAQLGASQSIIRKYASIQSENYTSGTFENLLLRPPLLVSNM